MIEISQSGGGEEPKPGRSSASTRWRRAKWGMFSSQFCQQPPSPWTKTIASGVLLGLGRPHLDVVHAGPSDVDVAKVLAPVDPQPLGIGVAVGIRAVRRRRPGTGPEGLDAPLYLRLRAHA